MWWERVGQLILMSKRFIFTSFQYKIINFHFDWNWKCRHKNLSTAESYFWASPDCSDCEAWLGLGTCNYKCLAWAWNETELYKVIQSPYSAIRTFRFLLTALLYPPSISMGIVHLQLGRMYYVCTIRLDITTH